MPAVIKAVSVIQELVGVVKVKGTIVPEKPIKHACCNKSCISNSGFVG
jgi:hypothetical protein